MLTRRSFLGTVAALAVSAPLPEFGRAGGGKSVVFDAPEFVWPRRDDGATILELR